ncbi:GNAT family N-acetyltransferase [Pseudonocardia asaccharolytica]|nr:GNAT family N-acetyltransferase [Pseudonocardia asaccharolytica]
MGAPIDQILLSGGERLDVRPIRTTDAPSLVAMHARLSADSIYRRYFGARPHLSPTDVRHFTTIDEEWRFALVGVRESGELAAVARYEGSPGSAVAELALVVDDALQGRGVGRAMLSRLIEVAAVRGLAALVADVLTRNAPMLRLLRTAGVPTTPVREPDSVRITLHLDGVRLPGPRRAVASAQVDEARAAARQRAGGAGLVRE